MRSWKWEAGAAACLCRLSRPDRQPHAGRGLGGAACVSRRRETALAHTRRVFPSGICPETEVVPVVWAADRQIQEVPSATPLDCRLAGRRRRSGGTDGSSWFRAPLCYPRLCRVPGCQQPEGCLARNRTGSRPRNTLAGRCQRPGGGPGPAFLDRLARALRILAARRIIRPAGRKAARPSEFHRVSSG